MPPPSKIAKKSAAAREVRHNKTEDEQCQPPLTRKGANELYDDWLSSFDKKNIKMLTVMLSDRLNIDPLNQSDSVEKAAAITGVGVRTVWRWREEFYSNSEFTQTARTCNEKKLFDDEAVRKKAITWIRENSFKKGEPNMKAADFCHFVNTHLLPGSTLDPDTPRTICVSTAVKWLHELGFEPTPHSKGTKKKNLSAPAFIP